MNELPPKESSLLNKKIKRRTLLGGAATAALVLVQTSFGKMARAAITQAETDPTKVPGVAPGELGTRSPFEKLLKTPSDTSSRTPLQNLYGTITPSDLHFERDHGG